MWKDRISDFLRFVKHGKKPKSEPVIRASREPKEITGLFYALYVCRNSHNWHTQTVCPYCGEELEHRLVIREIRFDEYGLDLDYDQIPIVRVEIKRSCSFIPTHLSVGIFDDLPVKVID